MEHSFSQSAWRRGWSDTKAVWTSWPFYVLDAVVAVMIGGLFLWYWGLFVVLFGMFCVWLGATASAPVRQRNEAREKVIALESTKKRLLRKGDRETIEIVYDRSLPFCVEMVADDTEGMYSIYRVGIRVKGRMSVEGVEVSLLGIKELGDRGSIPVMPTGCGVLEPMNHVTGSSCSFAVHPGYNVTSYVNVFHWNPSEMGITICGCGYSARKKLDMCSQYVMTLLAKGRDALETNYILTVSVGKEREISIEEVETEIWD